jgi:hypothetical protein
MSQRNLESTYPKLGVTGLPKDDRRTKTERQADASVFVDRHSPVRNDAASVGGHGGVKLDKTLRDCKTGYEGNPRLGHDNTLTTPNTGHNR